MAPEEASPDRRLDDGTTRARPARPTGSPDSGVSWRRWRDLNPRGSFKLPTRLAGGRHRPLGDTSTLPTNIVTGSSIG